MASPTSGEVGARTVPFLPIGAEASFKGVVDLLRMKAIIWHGDEKDSKFTEAEIPADLAEKAAQYRAQMIEAAVEMDDDIIASYIEKKEDEVKTINQVIKQEKIQSNI